MSSPTVMTQVLLLGIVARASHLVLGCDRDEGPTSSRDLRPWVQAVLTRNSEVQAGELSSVTLTDFAAPDVAQQRRLEHQRARDWSSLP